MHGSYFFCLFPGISKESSISQRLDLIKYENVFSSSKSKFQNMGKDFSDDSNKNMIRVTVTE